MIWLDGCHSPPSDNTRKVPGSLPSQICSPCFDLSPQIPDPKREAALQLDKSSINPDPSSQTPSSEGKKTLQFHEFMPGLGPSRPSTIHNRVTIESGKWSDEAMSTLLSLYEKGRIERLGKKRFRSRAYPTYKELAKSMKTMGYDVTVYSCRAKLYRLGVKVGHKVNVMLLDFCSFLNCNFFC